MANKAFSDWMRIDLHIHTDKSRTTKVNDYKGLFSIETLKQKLIENKVEIFSLTDHNIINVEAYREYYACERPTDPFLLLGVELDIVVTLNGVPEKDYHSLLVFNIAEVAEVERISRILEAVYSTKGITDQFKRKLTIDEIVKAFPTEDFFFIPHAGNSKSIVSGYKDKIQDAQRMVLLMQSAFEKVPEKAKHKYNEGFDRILSDDFQARDDLAYIDFSDNHNINKYPCVNRGDDGQYHQFWYIKGGKNFETLRLAFIDPKSRIKSTEEYKAISRSSITLDALKILQNKAMTANEIHFSPHLNVVVGGRSSGKSLLMFLLGEKTGVIRKGINDTYRDVVEADKTLIKSRLDDDYKDTTAISSNYIYINQGDIVRYFEHRDLVSLASKSGKTAEYQATITLFLQHKNTLSETIRRYLDCYRAVHDGGTKKFILHKTTITHIFSKSYVFLLNGDALGLKYGIGQQLEESEKLLGRIEIDIDYLLKDKNLVFGDNDFTIIERFQQLLTRKKELLKRNSSLVAKQLSFIKLAHEIVSDFNKAQSDEARAKRLAQENKDRLIKEAKDYLFLLKQLENSCRNLQEFNYTRTEKIPLNDDIDLAVEVPSSGKIKDLILDGLNHSDSAGSLFRNTLLLLRNIAATKIYKSNKPADLEKKINSQLSHVMASLDKPQDYLDYKSGETSKNKSPGFNSEKYLELVLRNPKNEIIFIDQPEDNLGNKFISDELVRIIREIKFSKQIFLVTHNPSIVVFGDAESIIIAENRDKIISYSQIVLEDKDAQKLICGILDGGEYVFDNRSRKYNIKRILREEKMNG